MKHKGQRVIFTLLAALVLVPAVQADFDQAMNYYKTGKYLEAAAEFQTLVDGAPNYDFGYFMLGTSFLKMNKPGDAETNLMKAIELNGEQFRYHFALAQAYLQKREYSKVVGALKTAEPLATDASSKYYVQKTRGLALASMEKWADAIDDLEQARKVKKTSDVVDRLAIAYYELRHYDKAVPVLREALQLAPKNDGMQARLAESLLNLAAEAKSASQKDRLYGEALTAAEKLSSMRPKSVDAHNLVGRAALGAGKYERAETAFREVIGAKSDHCWAMTNLGKTYNALGRWSDAELVLVDAARCDPRSAAAFSTLGFSQQKQKKLREALASYEKSYALKPSPSIETAMNVCKQNLDILSHNAEMSQLEAQQSQAEQEEQVRLAAEQAKREAWQKTQEKKN